MDVFELCCWRRLLRVPWTARRSNQSILKEINPKYSLKGLMLKLKLQYLGHMMQRTDSLEKTLMLGKIEGRRKRRWQRMRWSDNITFLNGCEFEQTLGDSGGHRSLECGIPSGHKEPDSTLPLKNSNHNVFLNGSLWSSLSIFTSSQLKTIFLSALKFLLKCLHLALLLPLLT